MKKLFSGQERLLEEEKKIQQAISEIVPPYIMDYMREHPAFKQYMFNPEYFKHQKSHPIFENTELLRGKIIYNLQ
jgi:hypothetical protein